MLRTYHIPLLVVLVALFMGCGRARYDARLVQADSLMWTTPDSALATLAAIDSLAGEATQAYRDLLMTQARYKTYQDITTSDDSAITRAMNYYRAHSGQREKLTRACLYKGAVMEELGHVDSAMYYYKTAEAAADPTDYLNLGQINTRIADLYRLNNCNEQTCFEKYQIAYRYHILADNKKMQLKNLCRMYMINGITKFVGQDTIFRKAINLANELQDDKMKFYMIELRCRQLSRSDSSSHQAKQMALECYKDFQPYINNDLLLDLAYLYAKENKLDSANLFLATVDGSVGEADQARITVRRLEILSIIAQHEGNADVSDRLTAVSSGISDSIMNCSDRFGIERIENDFNRLSNADNMSRISYLRWAIILLAVGALIVVLSLSMTFFQRLRRIKAIIALSETANSASLEQLLGQLDAKSVVVERLLSNLVALIKAATHEGALKAAPHLAQQVQETIVDVANDDFWNELRGFLDRNHGGIISKLEQMYSLKEKDLKFLELTCCGFSHAEIAIILNYSPKYVFSKRKILAQKMGLDMPLQDYVNSLMGKNQQD